jgi:hypothetical protein
MHWKSQLTYVPEKVDSMRFIGRVVIWIFLLIWGFSLMRMDYRTGEIGASFIHRPLLIFHEAGHVIFMPFGHWLMVLGGTLGQLIMPAILGFALLIKNRDTFGASAGLWLFGVSVLDVAPYAYDALEPQLMLLSGRIGEEGGHDWIYLLDTTGLLVHAHAVGGIIHKVGVLLVLLALLWGGWLLKQQYPRRAGFVREED